MDDNIIIIIFFFYLLLRRSISDHYLRSCGYVTSSSSSFNKVQGPLWSIVEATTDSDWGIRTGDLSAQSPRLYHCASPLHLYLYVGVLEQGDMQKKWFPRDGVRRVVQIVFGRRAMVGIIDTLSCYLVLKSYFCRNQIGLT